MQDGDHNAKEHTRKRRIPGGFPCNIHRQEQGGMDEVHTRPDGHLPCLHADFPPVGPGNGLRLPDKIRHNADTGAVPHRPGRHDCRAETRCRVSGENAERCPGPCRGRIRFRGVGKVLRQGFRPICRQREMQGH